MSNKSDIGVTYFSDELFMTENFLVYSVIDFFQKRNSFNEIYSSYSSLKKNSSRGRGGEDLAIMPVLFNTHKLGYNVN